MIRKAMRIHALPPLSPQRLKIFKKTYLARPLGVV